MPLVDRYILRQARASFLLVLGVLTAVVWMTSSLRQLDLLVTQGQTIFIFLGVTLLAIPLLLLLIAPFALFIAVLFTLNKLNTDSELIVMSAAGMSQARLLRPLLILAIAVTVAAWLLSLFVVPLSLRTLREAVTAARADFIGQVLQPGRFTTVDNGLTIHVRDRASNGLLLGVFVSDTRDAEIDMTYLGARGVIARTELGTFLVLESGQIVRKPKSGSSGSLISFETYALNLSAFVGQSVATVFPPQERWTWELFAMANETHTDPRLPGRIRSEIHDRFAGPLYPLVFGLAAFAFLGRAQTTRQGRTESVVLAIITVVILRILGFMASGLAQREAAAVLLVYAVPIGAGAVFLALSLTNWRAASLFDRLPLPALRARLARG